MHAMQYEITLPADYDMRVIRERVAGRGHLLDDHPGLGLKAYLIRERGAGVPVNQYAPFYLWSSSAGMNSFLFGAGFQGIVDDFGRPEVRHWTGVGYEEGPSAAAVPRTAVRDLRPVPRDVPLPALIDDAVAETRRLARLDGVVCAALAVDPGRWEVVRLTLWDRDSPDREVPGERFEVLHLSAPERDRLDGSRRADERR